MTTAATFKDHFSRQSGDYRRHRPGYPPDLITVLRELVGGTALQ